MSSIHPMSLLNLLRIRPFGLSSKNRDGAVNILEMCQYKYDRKWYKILFLYCIVVNYKLYRFFLPVKHLVVQLFG